ncbi:MAG: hypothetical protein K2N87_16110 [Eubacterium sp.]|nr:hypothetical protein [Eubacterium sp.]
MDIGFQYQFCMYSANKKKGTLRGLDIETAGGQGKSVGAICARANDCNIHSNKVYSIYD